MSLRIRSSAWLFFDKTDDPSIARCSICGASIKSYSSTTNLLKHLRSRHYDETLSEIKWDAPAANSKESSADDHDPDLEASESIDGEVTDELNSSSNVVDGLARLTSVSPIRINRSPVWFCFTRIKESNVAKCKFCSASLRYDSDCGTSGLMKHFMRKHDTIYQKVMAQIQLFKDGVNVLEGATENSSEFEYSEFKECLDSANSSAEVPSDVAALLEEDNDDLAAVVAEVALNHFVNSTDQRKTTRSLAWVCFTRIANSDVAVCKFCRTVVKTEGGSTSNMLNHFLRRHGLEYERAKAAREANEVVEQQADEITSDDVDNPNDSSQDDALLAELVSSERSNRLNKSIVWECFAKLSDKDKAENGSTEHECIHCGAHLKADQGTTSSMMAHFMKKHPDEYKEAISNRSTLSDSKSSLIRKYFIQLTNDDWSCSFCERLLRQPGSSVSNLVKHLSKKHFVEYQLILNELGSSAKSFHVKAEESFGDLDDTSDSVSNGATVESLEFSQPPPKRQKLAVSIATSSGESSLSKVSSLWHRHVQERQKEHNRQTTALKDKLSKLQESMKKIKEELAAVQGELSRTEDSWKKETVRHKEVNRQFQSALKSSETRKSGNTSNDDQTSELAMQVDDGE